MVHPASDNAVDQSQMQVNRQSEGLRTYWSRGFCGTRAACCCCPCGLTCCNTAAMTSSCSPSSGSSWPSATDGSGDSPPRFLRELRRLFFSWPCGLFFRFDDFFLSFSRLAVSFQGSSSPSSAWERDGFCFSSTRSTLHNQGKTQHMR